MTKIATILLTHEPEEARVTEIAELMADTYGPSYPSVTWFLSHEVPPQAKYGVDVIDQLNAHKRDAPGSVFLTVVMSADELEDDSDE